MATFFAGVVVVAGGSNLLNEARQTVPEDFYEQFTSPGGCLAATDYAQTEPVTKGVLEPGRSEISLPSPGNPDEVAGTWTVTHNFTNASHYDFTPADDETRKLADIYECPAPDED